MSARSASRRAAWRTHGDGDRRAPACGVWVGRAVGRPVPRGVGRAVGDPLRDGVAVGATVGFVVRPTVRDGVGRVDALGDGLEELGPGVSVGVGCPGAAGGPGVDVVTTSAGRLCPPPATGMSGAAGFGSSRPTPGTDRGSSPGEDTTLMTNSVRYAEARPPTSQPVQRNQRRRRPLSSTKIGNRCDSPAASGGSVM